VSPACHHPGWGLQVLWTEEVEGALEEFESGAEDAVKK
jgi:hypothetical protein